MCLFFRRANTSTMRKQALIIGLLAAVSAVFGCNSQPTDNTSKIQIQSQDMAITVETMKQVLDAFNRHDLDAIMEFFSEDCSLDVPRGPKPWGQRLIGKAQVREGL